MGKMRFVALLAALASLLAVAGSSSAAEPGRDYDGDGFVASDCSPLDPAVFPGATDLPDLAFEDMNCDGIDGDASQAVFVAPSGDDAATGSKGNPKRTVSNGIATAEPLGKDVYIAGGTYSESVLAADGVGLYGGYLPFTGARSTSETTIIEGARQAVLADGDDGVVLQLLTLRGAPDATRNAYGLRAINNSRVALRAVEVIAADSLAAPVGNSPAQPLKPAGSDGTPGGAGTCASGNGAKGEGGAPNGAYDGGDGGAGGINSGDAGDPGVAGQNNPGSEGAAGPANGGNGGAGGLGVAGGSGGNGSHGTFTLANAATDWVNGSSASNGGSGGLGSGGGGGGGGGGDSYNVGGLMFHVVGGGGGGGGGGGIGGAGGGSGINGAGSFGAYLMSSSLAAVDSRLRAGNGGSGGDGGDGAAGGPPGLGASGGDGDGTCGFPAGDGGAGRNGGLGGDGGDGGGGAGGPSAGVFRTGAVAVYSARNSTEEAGAAGLGGTRGSSVNRAPSGQASARLDAPSVVPGTTADFDDDGLVDSADACPEIPRGTSDTNGDGCPDRPAKLADTDADGIPDSHDRCPTIPRGPQDADEDGCPDVQPQPQPQPQPQSRPAAVRCVVPNVKGKTVAQARKLLVAKRCALGKTTRAYSRKAKAGRIISQSKRPGARLARATKVNVTVSRGRRR